MIFMKKNILFGLALLLLSSCSQENGQEGDEKPNPESKENALLLLLEAQALIQNELTNYTLLDGNSRLSGNIQARVAEELALLLEKLALEPGFEQLSIQVNKAERDRIEENEDFMQLTDELTVQYGWLLALEMLGVRYIAALQNKGVLPEENWKLNIVLPSKEMTALKQIYLDEGIEI